MKSFSRIVVVLVLLTGASVLQAANLVGTWKGKVTVDLAKAPKPQNPQQQKALDDGMAMIRKMEILLVLKADKTYRASAKNVPGKAGTDSSEGTWKQTGNELWLSPIKDNGKPAADKKPQKFLILDGGKKLAVAVAEMPAWVKVTFTR